MSATWLNLLSGLIGAIIGGLFTILGTLLSYHYQRKNDAKNEENKAKIFLISIRAEITSVWNRYSESMGKVVESLPDEMGLDSYYPLSENYFSVYDCNSSMTINLGTVY